MVNFSIYGGDSSVVRLNVRIKLPKLDRKVELRAEMDDELVKKATLNPKDEGEWVVTFASEYVSEEAKIYIDGELFQKLELDFVHGTHTILRDYTSDFVDDE